LNNTSIALHSLGVTAIAIAVLAKAPTHQSAKFVFATFNDGTGDPGWSVRASPAYVAVCGILMSQYTLTVSFSLFGKNSWSGIPKSLFCVNEKHYL